MRSHQLTALLLGMFSVAAASAAEIVLYDGTSSPTAQGWQQAANAGGGTITAQVQSDGTTRFTTTSGAQTSATNIYYYSTGASNYIASIRLKVLASGYNSLDAGLMFTSPGNGTNSLPYLNATGRSNMLTITNGSVLWGDLGASATVTPNDFHEYAIRYQNGKLDIYIDATYADIQSGAATPMLSRTPPAFTIPGVVIFGDQTNDPNVDSDYYVDFVKFQNLDMAAPTLAVTSSGSSTYGASVTFTATLSGASNPTGTVTFCADDATCAAPSWSCTVPVSGTSATCSTAILAAGNHAITASYTGDAQNDPASTSSTLVQVVAPAMLKITPTSGQSKVYGGADPASFTYSTTGLVAGSTLSGALSRAPGENVGSYAFALGTLAVSDAGDYTISLGVGTFAITPAPLTITATSRSKTYGQTATLAGTGFTSTALRNGESIGTVALTSAGAVATASVAGSPYAIVPSAATGGTFNPANYAITYANGTLTVNPAPLTITANNANMTYGGPLPTFSASYAGFVNADTAAILTPLPTFSTTATSTSPVGTYAITPAGAAAANYSISYANGVLTISSASSALNLTPPSSLQVGATGTITATSTATNSTQNIVITSTTPAVCSVSNIGASATQASATLTGLIAGSCILAASQAADANYTAQSSGATVTVGRGATSVTITAPPTATVGQPISVGATVTASGTTTPTGTIAISDGVGDQCTIRLPATSCSVTPGSGGSQTLTATYSGDGNFVASTTATMFNVSAGSSNIGLVSAPNPSIAGQTVTFTATVSPAAAPAGSGTSAAHSAGEIQAMLHVGAAAATAPTGSVTFAESVTTLATVALTGGVATYNTSVLAAGAHPITATYSGDSSNAAASVIQVQVVNAATIPTATAVPAPALSPWMLILLGLILAGAGATYGRASRVL